MNIATQQALAAVNERFYREHAADFSRTRFAPWAGWTRLLAEIQRKWPAERLLRVVDVGCGNGRFGALVGERWAGAWSYLGLDASPELLAAADERLSGVADRQLREWNLLADSLPETAASLAGLVTIFGVLHHVPGAAQRRRLLLEAASLLEPGGFLAFTVWRFGEDPRFQHRVLDWQQLSSLGGPAVDPAELEAGDCLLRWGDSPGAVRYCHAVAEAEMDSWLADLALEPVLRFEGDGKSGRLNRYFLLRG
jgi:SAM-dependent methyltransferase